MKLHHCPDTRNSNSSQQNEDVLEVAEEILGKDAVKESRSLVLYDAKERTLHSSRTDVGDLDGFWQVSEFDNFYSIDSNTAESRAMEVKDHESLNYRANENPQLVTEKMQQFSDKSKNELEESELVICHKENSYLDVKDIYVNEDMPSRQRILFETEVRKKDLRTLLLLEKEGSNDLTTETKDVTAPTPGHTKFCEGPHSVSPDSQVVSEDITRTEVKVYEVAEDVSISCIWLKDQDSATVIIQQEPPSEGACNEDTMSLKEPGSTGPSPTPADEESANILHAKESKNDTLSDLEEEISADPAKESKHNNDRSDSSDNGNQENQAPDQNIPKVHDSRVCSFQDQQSLGETSFSRTSTVSGLITYSGHIVYAGNLSQRSDSSTTSSRSFAFPILQAEWHSSPVRMATADQRHFRKRKRWRLGLLCCGF